MDWAVAIFEMTKLDKHAKNTFLSWLVCNEPFLDDSLHFHHFQDVEPGWIALAFVTRVGSDSYRKAESDTLSSLQWRPVWLANWTPLFSLDQSHSWLRSI